MSSPSLMVRRQSLRENVARLTQSLNTLQVGHIEQDDAIAVHVSKIGFVFFWIMMLAARCCCIVFLAGTTRLYWFVAHPYMTYYASLLGPRASSLLKPVGLCFGAMAIAHFYEVARMLYFSLKWRRLVFDSPITTKPAQVMPAPFWGFSSFFDSTPKALGRVGYYIRASRARWLSLFDRRGFFGVESDFFHLRFLSRELFEIISQTWQVYNSSVLIAKVWINNLYVSIVLLNCCSTPVLQSIFHKRPPLERLLCLMCDLVLDAVISIILPLVIFLPYYRKFDFEIYNFEIAYLYDDVWFANMVMENQQIFALTKWDFFWKLIPHLSMYSCLASLKALIRAERCKKSSTSSSSTVLSSRTTIVQTTPVDAWLNQGSQLSYISERSVGPSPFETSELQQPAAAPPKVIQVKLPERSPPPLPRRPKRRFRRKLITKGGALLKIANAGLVLWGIGILVFHLLALRASKTADIAGCKQATRPWFATNVSCSVLQYNCHQYNTTDIRVEDLDILQDESIVALVISHCPELRVPPAIQKFRNLLGVDIFNSTLYEWSADAAITNVTHPRLVYIIFVHVNMTQLPEGVLQAPPATFADFELAGTNLTHLPANLHKIWGTMSVFYVEHSLVSEFPSSLMELPVDDLSLVGSQIKTLPEFPSQFRGFFTLAMTHTPLEALPNSIGDISSLGFLSLGYTQIRELPAWMSKLEKTATKIYLHDTPFCQSKSTEELAHTFGDEAVLSCTAIDDREAGKYPLSLMLLRRPYEPMTK